MNNRFKQPQNWAKRFSQEQARWDDTRRTGLLVIPVVAVATWVLLSAYFLIFVTDFFGLSADHLSNEMLIRRLILSIATPVICAVLTIALYILAARAARNFFADYYQPEEDINIRKILSLRLFGVAPVPPPLTSLLRYPFILLNIDEISKGAFNLETHPAHWMGGPYSLIVLDGAGLYLERGNKFSRTLGPGIHFLERFETIKGILDLRQQTVRSGQPGMPPAIAGRTKDGIRIFINIEISYHINRPAPDNITVVTAEQAATLPDLSKEEIARLINRPINAGDPVSMRQAFESVTVKNTGAEDINTLVEADWRSGVWGTVSGYMAKYITQHFLDDLLAVDVPNFENMPPPEGSENLENRNIPMLSWQERENIRTELNKTLQQTRGITLTDLRLVGIELPPVVLQQRVEVRNTAARSRLKEIEGISNAEQTRIREDAYARALSDFIDNLPLTLGGIDEENFSESLLLSLSNMLSQGLSDPALAAYMARETLDTIKQLRDFLEKES